MKVSKVVMIVVALHVLVIGGIFVFEGCTRAKAPNPAIAENEMPADAAGAADATALPADATGLTPGQASLTPTALAPVAPVAPVAVAKTYVIKKGDTLARIAKSQGTTVVELAKANNLTKTSILKINQKLTIPAKAEAAPTQVAAITPAGPIASVDAAAPVAPVSGNSYAVKSGDSLWKIAKANNISVASLKQANNLTSDALKVNQKLVIPTTTAPASAPVQAGISTASYDTWQPGTHNENGQTIHIVNFNETPSVIAQQYGVKVDELMKANNISNTKRIQVGQKLVIPAPAAPATTATPAMAAPIVSAVN